MELQAYVVQDEPASPQILVQACFNSTGTILLVVQKKRYSNKLEDAANLMVPKYIPPNPIAILHFWLVGLHHLYSRFAVPDYSCPMNVYDKTELK